MLCAADQYASGHLFVTILGKSDLEQTQKMLKELFLELGMSWFLEDLAGAKDTCASYATLSWTQVTG